MIQNLSGKKILVTGGAGFLGSFICERLVDLDCKVICLDNLFTGSHRNIEALFQRDNFDFILSDVCDAVEFEVDVIINLACPASPIHYQKDPVKTLKTNVLGILNVLELAKRKGARVFQASTSEVYGDPEVHPQVESYWGHVNPIGLRSCYDEGKRCAETLCFDYKRQYGIDVRVARIFNTYGPRMSVNDGRVVSNFITQALSGQAITIYGDGSQTRSFCYVEDLIEAILIFVSLDNAPSSPINIGNPAETSIKSLAMIIGEKVGVDLQLIEGQLPSDDPLKRKPDISKASEMLGWRPQVPLSEGLSKTIKYFSDFQE